MKRTKRGNWGDGMGRRRREEYGSERCKGMKRAERRGRVGTRGEQLCVQHCVGSITKGGTSHETYGCTGID